MNFLVHSHTHFALADPLQPNLCSPHLISAPPRFPFHFQVVCVLLAFPFPFLDTSLSFETSAHAHSHTTKNIFLKVTSWGKGDSSFGKVFAAQA